jgi:hypothetical protein
MSYFFRQAIGNEGLVHADVRKQIVTGIQEIFNQE